MSLDVSSFFAPPIVGEPPDTYPHQLVPYYRQQRVVSAFTKIVQIGEIEQYQREVLIAAIFELPVVPTVGAQRPIRQRPSIKRKRSGRE